MNIIFDARVIQDHFPGIGRYAYNLLKHLPAHLHTDERITALYDSTARSMHLIAHDLQNECITFVDYRVPLFSLRNFIPPPASIGASSSLYHFTYYVRPHMVRQPSVTTVYDAISHIYPQLVPSPRARLIIHLLVSLAISTSRAILTISQSAARDIAHYYPASRGKITVTPLAPDSRFQPSDDCEKSIVRRQYALPDHFVLYLASNKPHKNLVRLVDAWAMMMRDWGLRFGDGESPIPNPQSLPILVIAGHQDPRYSEAQARAHELGIVEQVMFIGDIPDCDLPALYSACDLFVFPSLYEGFGLPPLEAMACGAPVVCSNASSIPEVTGDAAILFDPLDPSAIAAALRRVLENGNLAQEMRERSLKQAARFSWDACARATMDVYRDIAKRPK